MHGSQTNIAKYFTSLFTLKKALTDFVKNVEIAYTNGKILWHSPVIMISR